MNREQFERYVASDPDKLRKHTARDMRARQEFTANFQSHFAHQMSARADAADAADESDDERHTHHYIAAFENRTAQTRAEELGWADMAATHAAKVDHHGAIFHALGGHGRKSKLAR